MHTGNLKECPSRCQGKSEDIRFFAPLSSILQITKSTGWIPYAFDVFGLHFVRKCSRIKGLSDTINAKGVS
jgi:hypothetical protein